MGSGGFGDDVVNELTDERRVWLFETGGTKSIGTEAARLVMQLLEVRCIGQAGVAASSLDPHLGLVVVQDQQKTNDGQRQRQHDGIGSLPSRVSRPVSRSHRSIGITPQLPRVNL